MAFHEEKPFVINNFHKSQLSSETYRTGCDWENAPSSLQAEDLGTLAQTRTHFLLLHSYCDS